MSVEYATSREAADPYCLRPGEASALLAGHPWRRFVVVGDSTAEGVGDPTDGYVALPWADRIAAELTGMQPGLSYANLGQRNLRIAQIRARQLDAALALAPDLALVTGGGNDAIDPRYDPDAVDRDLAAIVSALRDRGADVITISPLVLDSYPGLPGWLGPRMVDRLRLLARRTGALGAALGTVHVDLTGHPALAEPHLLLSRDGLHGNGRSHAISAAAAVRRLGAHLGNTFTPGG